MRTSGDHSKAAAPTVQWLVSHRPEAKRKRRVHAHQVLPIRPGVGASPFRPAPVALPSHAANASLSAASSTAGMAEQMLRQGLGLWEAAFTLWFDYTVDLSACSTPQAFAETTSRLLASGIRLPELAGGVVLREAGLEQPLLNDG